MSPECGFNSCRAAPEGEDEATASAGGQVTERLQVADLPRPQPARRSGPRACRFWSPSTVVPGRAPPLFCPGTRPGPCSGVAYAPLVGGVVSTEIARASHSPDAVNRRSECRLDRSLIAHSIHPLIDRAADASIPAVETRRGTPGGTPPPREVFPLWSTLLRPNRSRRKCAEASDCFRQIQSALRVAGHMRRAAFCAAR